MIAVVRGFGQSTPGNVVVAGKEKGTDFVPGEVPKVMSSETTGDGAALLVKFDRPMSKTADLQDAMIVKIDGTTVKPDRIEQDSTKSLLGMIYPVDFFKPGQVITWAYNDQHPTEELKGAETGGKEIDNQTYAVINRVTATPVVKSSEIYANNDKRIVVEWDQEMMGTSDIRFAIFIAIDGGAPILPETVIFTKNAGKFYMMLVMTNPMIAGQNIVWHYDSSTNERLSTKIGSHEATDVPHVVDNKLADAPTIIEDEPFDIIVGTAGGDNGFSDDLAFGSLPIDVEIDGHPLTTLYVDHSNRLLFMDFAGMLAPWNAATIKITLGTTGQEVELLWDVGLKMYSVESVAAMNYFTVNDGTALGFIIHSPDTSDPGVDPVDDPILDLDGDGNPDTVIYDDNGILITEDADSFDIDLDGDGIADISVHK